MGDVIELDFSRNGKITEASESIARCHHRSTVVDVDERTISCAACGAVLDPIEVLLGYARNERNVRSWEREVAEAVRQLKELRAEERRVKARLKNASRKDAAVAVNEERVRTERMRMAITEQARDIAQACRAIERLAQRRTT